MPKTEINTILKNGADAKIIAVDYTSPKKKKELRALKKKTEEISKRGRGNRNRPLIVVTT